MWRLKSEQKIIDIDGVKVGGIPGKNPSVLIGTIFYKNHKIVADERRGLFIRSKAEELINIQEEFSDKTGNPCMLDVVGATSKAMIKYLDFVADISSCPILVDGVSPLVAIDALKHVKEVGLSHKIIYNSITPDFEQHVLDALLQNNVNNIVLLAYCASAFTSKGRYESIVELIPKLVNEGITSIMVDTFVLDIPSMGSACRTIFDVKNELGYPAGCGAHNAIGTWTGLETKMGRQAKNPSMAVACTLAIAVGGDFVFYGPIEGADFIFPTVSFVDAAFAQLNLERGERLDGSHPIFRIS